MGGGHRSAARRLRSARRAAVHAVLLVTLMLAAPAAGDEVGELRQEVGDLRQTVHDLNDTVQQLKQQLTAPPETPTPGPQEAATPSPSPTPGLEGLRQGWRDISHGMTPTQVTALIGQAQGTIDMSPRVVWYYSYPAGSGSVVFIDGTVVDWQTPPFASWLSEWW